MDPAGGRAESRLVDLPLHHQALAILETTAHLDVLVLAGHLMSQTSDGVQRYAPAT